ncbi:MAG: YbjN domain-containing protein [Proteobacteria bacterium]|nr:YbjN domain-containing protein [Pseudomonadota bacterium]
MRLKRILTALVLISLLLPATAMAKDVKPNSVPATNVNAILPEEEVAVPRLKTYFDGAFLNCTIDEDGDLRIEDGGLISFCTVDEDKKLLTFFALFPLRASAPELKKLQLINQWNDQLMIVRFAMSDPTTLWCDYQFSYEKGLSPFFLVNSYRQFQRVVIGAVTTRDPDDLASSDSD